MEQLAHYWKQLNTRSLNSKTLRRVWLEQQQHEQLWPVSTLCPSATQQPNKPNKQHMDAVCAKRARAAAAARAQRLSVRLRALNGDEPTRSLDLRRGNLSVCGNSTRQVNLARAAGGAAAGRRASRRRRRGGRSLTGARRCVTHGGRRRTLRRRRSARAGKPSAAAAEPCSSRGGLSESPQRQRQR